MAEFVEVRINGVRYIPAESCERNRFGKCSRCGAVLPAWFKHCQNCGAEKEAS